MVQSRKLSGGNNILCSGFYAAVGMKVGVSQRVVAPLGEAQNSSLLAFSRSVMDAAVTER
ncbi:hypothetical protein NQZ68_013449 [Dissostichus eleginoides]|nr:hypothetical protein NQZ68_013449 [Dissostichus eleginoides]